MTDSVDHQPVPTEVRPHIWRWTAPHPEWRNVGVPWTWEVASFALADSESLLLVDPLLPAADDAAQDVLGRLDALAASAKEIAIFVTIPYHVRSSEQLLERYAPSQRVTLHAHPAASKRLRRGARLADITRADPLPAGAVAFRIGKPVRFETPVYFPVHRALAFGDAVVGVDGGLRVWASIRDAKRARWYEERFLPTLEPLADLDVESVLVTHGLPVLDDGRRHLERAFASPPWHYR